MDQSGFTRSGPRARQLQIGIRSGTVLAVLLGASLMIGSGAMGGEDDRRREATSPERSGDEPYWTPERLRAAKPLPLPHPAAPPPEAAPGTGAGTPSVSGAGSPGSGEVPPDDEDLLEPRPEPSKP